MYPTDETSSCTAIRDVRGASGSEPDAFLRRLREKCRHRTKVGGTAKRAAEVWTAGTAWEERLWHEDAIARDRTGS